MSRRQGRHLQDPVRAAGQAQAGVSFAGASEEEEAEDAAGGDSFGEAKAARLAAARRMIIFSLRY